MLQTLRNPQILSCPTNSPREFIELKSLKKSFKKPQSAEANHVLCGLNLKLERGKITVLVGRSGCGKTTLLHILAGLSALDSGSITPANPHENAGVVFQDHRLLPWFSAEDNLRLALRSLKHLAKEEKEYRVAQMLEALSLTDARKLRPAELSGGMAQRVALGRALLLEPQLLLMDEPFAALDAITRAEMQQLLLNVHTSRKCTTVFVTHDIREAVLLADRITVMDQGRIADDFALTNPHPRAMEQPALQSQCARIAHALGLALL